MLPANLKFLPLKLDSQARKLQTLDKQKLSILEGSSVSIKHKIDILRLLTGRRWLLEVLDPVDDLLSLAKELNIPFSHDGSSLFLGATSAVLEYMKVHEGQLSDFEKATLEGYPKSSVLVVAGLMPSKAPEDDIVDFYLGGIYSKDSYSDERIYYEQEWAHIMGVSKEILRQAEQYYSARK